MKESWWFDRRSSCLAPWCYGPFRCLPAPLVASTVAAAVGIVLWLDPPLWSGCFLTGPWRQMRRLSSTLGFGEQSKLSLPWLPLFSTLSWDLMPSIPTNVSARVKQKWGKPALVQPSLDLPSFHLFSLISNGFNFFLVLKFSCINSKREESSRPEE